MTQADEIDYEIGGSDMQYVRVELDPGEAAVAEAGSMLAMDPWIQMQTILGDGSSREKGILSKLASTGRRVITGESLFMTAFIKRE